MPAVDLANSSNSIVAPSSNFATVTKSDSTDLNFLTRALYIGGAGDVACVDVNNNVVVFTAVPVGAVLPVRVRRVNSTGTSATGIVAMW